MYEYNYIYLPIHIAYIPVHIEKKINENEIENVNSAKPPELNHHKKKRKNIQIITQRQNKSKLGYIRAYPSIPPFSQPINPPSTHQSPPLLQNYTIGKKIFFFRVF